MHKRSFVSTGATVIHAIRPVPNLVAGCDTVYHNTRFQVVVTNGDQSLWTAQEKSLTNCILP
jgi:hypothetical protein